MKKFLRQENEIVFALAFAAAFLLGLFLRLYLLPDQVFSDDEWHGLYFVIGKSPGWLLTHFSIPGATCIPLNFYTWALGASIGWSETMLRLPSIICGLLCVLIGPLLARNIIGPRRAAWLTLLLAISPLLIFYSRICRPYSAVVFLDFVAILFAARWMQSGDRRSAALFVVAGTMAVYFHLFAVVTLAAPLLVALVYQLRAWLSKTPHIALAGPPLRHWLIAVTVMGVLSSILLLPALIHSLHGTLFSVALTGTLRLESLPQALMLIAGTGQPVMALLFWAAFIAGAVDQCRRNPRFGWMLLSLYPLYALALIISRPNSAQAAIVLVRYSIPLVPVSLLLVACGIQATLESIAARIMLRPGLQALIAFAWVAALALVGPLPQCYVAPNNFTSHGVYQHRYGLIDWSHSFYSDFTPAGSRLNTVIRAGEVSPFYEMLADHPDGRPIVEYPMLIGDHFNPLYYYQHFHRRPVIVGYTTDVELLGGLAPGNIYGNTYVDEVLSLIKDQSRVRFRNMISMDDLAAMRARGVQSIVLHKRFEAQLSEVAAPPPDLGRLYHEYQGKLGAPAYEDANVVVFRL
jgi:Dolichyl-phosphate-mannose-protein mannosyltransferase